MAASARLRVALVVVSLVASVALSELLLRAAWRNPYRGESPDHVVALRKHHVNRDIPIDRGRIYPDDPVSRFRTDARSYQLPARRHESPDFTIVFLGGSTTECSAVSEGLRFTALVSDLLGERGLSVNTLNAARSGNTSHDSLNVLLNHVAADAPDVVVMMHAANDIGVLARDGSYAARMGSPAGPGRVAKWLLQEASTRSALAGALRWTTTMVAPQREGVDWDARRAERGSVPSEPFQARLRAFVGIVRAFGGRPVLMTQPASNVRTDHTPDWMDLTNQARFNDAIRAVARSEDALLIDLASHLVSTVPDWDRPMNVFYDGVHVTDFGSRLYAAHIAQRLYDDALAPTPSAPGS